MSNDSSAGVGDGAFVKMVKSYGEPPKDLIKDEAALTPEEVVEIHKVDPPKLSKEGEVEIIKEEKFDDDENDRHLQGVAYVRH